MKFRMKRITALRVLLIEWFLVTLFLSGILFIQSMMGKYGEDAGEAWEWLINGAAPPLALLLGAALSDDAKAWGKKNANVFRAVCAIAICTLFLATLVGTILLEPMLSSSSFELLRLSGYGMGLWLGIVFGAISAVLFDGR